MNVTPDWLGYAIHKQQNVFASAYYQAVNYCHVAALRSLATSPVPAALDIACGDGYSCIELGKFAEHVTGIDCSMHQIQQAHARGLGDKFQFVCTDLDRFQACDRPFGIISGTWFLNHLHDADSLRRSFAKIHALLAKDGIISFVVPSDAFTSLRIQNFAYTYMGWELAWSPPQPEYTRGLFRFDSEWIPTTAWQPMFLMKLLNEWFDIHLFDVHSTLVNEHLLSQFNSEPPFAILYGSVRS